MRRLVRSLLIPFALAAAPAPARADEANLSKAANDSLGAVSRLIVAQRGYEMALKSGDAILLLVSIRLARGVVLRSPVAWDRQTEGEAPADQPKGKDAAPDPASSAALVIVQNFAGDDPDLQDQVYDLDAQLPQSRKETAVEIAADLGVGQVDHWRLPLFGEVPAEIGLIGDGDGPLSLTITDEGGATACALPASFEPGLCRFIPARNGFFTVTVRNGGASESHYRLLGN